MITIISSFPSIKDSVYFGDADSYTVKLYNISSHDIHINLKIACLRYSHVFLSAAYLWQTPQLEYMFHELASLIKSQSVIPTIRNYNVCNNIVDYFCVRRSELINQTVSSIHYGNGLVNEIAHSSQKCIALQFDKLKTYSHVDNKSVRDSFSVLLINDISNICDPYSLMNICSELYGNTNLFNDVITALLRCANEELLSRSLVANCLDNYALSSNELFCILNRVSELYLMANANSCGCQLLLTNRASKYEFDHYDIRIKTVKSVNLKVFRSVLSRLGISDLHIYNINAFDLLEIRNSYEFNEFLIVYNKICDNAIKHTDNVADSVLSQIQYSIKYENKRILMRKIARLLVNIMASYYSDILLDTLPPLKKAIVNQIGSDNINKVLDNLNYIQQSPLVDFKSYLWEEKYKEKLYRRCYKEGFANDL